MLCGQLWRIFFTFMTNVQIMCAFAEEKPQRVVASFAPQEKGRHSGKVCSKELGHLQGQAQR